MLLQSAAVMFNFDSGMELESEFSGFQGSGKLELD